MKRTHILEWLTRTVTVAVALAVLYLASPLFAGGTAGGGSSVPSMTYGGVPSMEVAHTGQDRLPPGDGEPVPVPPPGADDDSLPGGGGPVIDGDGDSCPADLNGDGAVNVQDLIEVLESFDTCAFDQVCPADLDGSGTVDVLDLIVIVINWGECG